MADTDIIREKFFTEGKNKTEISLETGFDRRTIRKYIELEDWNEDITHVSQRESKLDPFKKQIYEWIENDKLQRRKQRHTAFRIFTRLQELYPGSFNCSYKTVANYVAKIKKEIFNTSKGALPLDHIPGEAQVDFGSADFIENGTRYSGKYLVLTFPYSNAGYMQLFHGETYECLAEGMKSIFEYIGGVPSKIWFDNASSMVASILEDGKRNLTDSFTRFKNHYGFEASFCNPGKGNEKGNVENKVGYFRRNLLVPIPEFKNIEEYNKILLEKCDNDMDRIHYSKKISVKSLFNEDSDNLSKLSATPLDIVSYTEARVNNYGKIKLNNGVHTYSVVPRLSKEYVTVCLRAHNITILDTNFKEVVSHRRFYGKETQESMNWIPYLDQIAKYPTAFKYTGIRNMLPDPVKEYIERLDTRNRGEALRILSKITDETSFENGLEVFSKALDYEIKDSDSLITIYNSQITGLPTLEHIPVPDNIPKVEPIKTNLKPYDSLLRSNY